ncbi:hypothetical protein ACHMXB_17800 [Arthrobacter sp. UC242_113]|uniref:hypothetical protein n=1 Tax=Arthrobacter sp. UC242_113 TaxID=3374550 RepID=UPI0037583853
MGNQLKKSMNRFYHETKTPRGNFWEKSAGSIASLLAVLNDGASEAKNFAATPITAGVDGSNCPLLAAERKDVSAYMKQFLSTAEEVFVGRSSDFSTIAYCDLTHNYISLSAKHLNLLAVYAASIMQFQRLAEASQSETSPDSTLLTARSEFDAVLADYVEGNLDQSRGSAFVKETYGEYSMSHLRLTSKAESWMIAHEYGHLIARKDKKRLLEASDPFMASLFEVPLLQQEYLSWGEEWREEFRCDALACLYLLREADPSTLREDTLFHLMSALQAPIVALSCAETLIRQPGLEEEDDTHPSSISRIVLLVFSIVRRCGTLYARRSLDTVGGRLLMPTLFFFSASLLEYVLWMLGEKAATGMHFPGVQGMSVGETTEFRYKHTYEFLVELSLGDIAEDAMEYGMYWLSLGKATASTPSGSS